MYCVGVAEKVFESGFSRYMTFFGAVPWSPTFLPAISPLVNSGVILSAFLMRRVSMPSRLPVGMIFLSEKYSVSIRSKELGAVTARLVTSSVVTGMYWIVMPVSALNLSAIALSWFTAVPRSEERRVGKEWR